MLIHTMVIGDDRIVGSRPVVAPPPLSPSAAPVSNGCSAGKSWSLLIGTRILNNIELVIVVTKK
jgi:hypothetical protein